METFKPIGSMNLTNTYQYSVSLARWGEDGLAVRFGTNGIYLVQASAFVDANMNEMLRITQ